MAWCPLPIGLMGVSRGANAMKRLFEVAGEYFDNKKAAKERRDLLNSTGAHQQVHLGPDHWRFK